MPSTGCPLHIMSSSCSWSFCTHDISWTEHRVSADQITVAVIISAVGLISSHAVPNNPLTAKVTWPSNGHTHLRLNGFNPIKQKDRTSNVIVRSWLTSTRQTKYKETEQTWTQFLFHLTSAASQLVKHTMMSNDCIKRAFTPCQHHDGMLYKSHIMWAVQKHPRLLAYVHAQYQASRNYDLAYSWLPSSQYSYIVILIQTVDHDSRNK